VLLVLPASARTSPFDTGTNIRRLISASGSVCGYNIGRTNAATTSALCNMNEASAVHRLAGCSSITANPENMGAFSSAVVLLGDKDTAACASE